MTVEYLDITGSLAALDALSAAQPELGLERHRLAPNPALADTMRDNLDPWLLPDDYDHLLRNGGIFVGFHGAASSIDLATLRAEDNTFRPLLEELFPEAPWGEVSITWVHIGTALHRQDCFLLPLMMTRQESGSIGMEQTQDLTCGKFVPSLAMYNQAFVVYADAMGDEMGSGRIDSLWHDSFREEEVSAEQGESPGRFAARIRAHQALRDFAASAPATHPAWTGAPGTFVADFSEYELWDVASLLGMPQDFSEFDDEDS